ncbi:MAG: hypothetical protein P4L69_21920 [Desulfosporosinus sp.]|nr:hypothetical protein [Desulfosporosinus sp.]
MIDGFSLQKADNDGVATPANWGPGDDCIVPTAGLCALAKERMETPAEDTYCLDWLCASKSRRTFGQLFYD